MNFQAQPRALASLALVLAASCATQQGTRTKGALDDGLMQFVAQPAQQEVQDARVSHLEATDKRAAAEYRVEHADSDRRVLVAEMRAARDKVNLEKARVDAMTDVKTGATPTEEAIAALAKAHEAERTAEHKISLHEAQIAVLKAELNLAQAEEAHADAVVNVWKARAIKSLNNEKSSAIDVFEYETVEHDCGTEIEIAKIRLWSAQSKVQRLEERLRSASNH